MYRVRRMRAFGAVLLVLVMGWSPAFAQSSAKDVAFAALLEDPSNPDLMLQYAQLAIEDGDYEAALATLERLIDLDPTSQQARFELAVAYFALGVDDVAQYHLDVYSQRSDLTSAEETRAARYEDALVDRFASTSVSGAFEAGLVYRSETDDVGVTGTLALNLRQDLGGARSATWQTNARLIGLNFAEQPDDDLVRLLVRTGPVFAIDGTAVGTRVQPFLTFDLVEDGGGADSGLSYGAGVAFSKPVNEEWSIFFDAEGGAIDRSDGGIDSLYLVLDAGATWQATQSTALRFTIGLEREDADTGGIDNTRIEGGLSLFHETTVPLFGATYAATLSGFAQFARDSASDGIDDDVASFGANIRTYFSDTIYLDVGLQTFTRSSSDPVFDDEDTIVAISAGWEF